ncbi:unnamed protein product [Anisakis simplex]|uniref:HIG1 domain-containing protein n=1 Tax=Anisakis simplex TaxID=6269 RepID=A0A0M3JQE7_ANISI|nr:unnamed protein product [Anisakis simplex]
MQHAMGNPGVVLGMGLTALALLGMMRSSFLGDKLQAQKYMRSGYFRGAFETVP